MLVLLAVQGASAAMVPAAMFALMPRVAPKALIGTYFGFVIAASVVGITLGRSGMGMMTARFGLAGALQVCGLVLFAAAALNQTLPLSQRVNTASTTLRSAYANALRMLAAPQLLRLFGTGFLLFFGYLGMLTFLTLRLHQAPFMFDSAAIGSISLLGLSALFGAPLSGRLTAKFGSLPVAISGLMTVMVAIACLAAAETTHALALGLFLLFFGVFSCQPAVFVRIAERVNRLVRLGRGAHHLWPTWMPRPRLLGNTREGHFLKVGLITKAKKKALLVRAFFRFCSSLRSRTSGTARRLGVHQR